jgi:putative acetyltransferase
VLDPAWTPLFRVPRFAIVTEQAECNYSAYVPGIPGYDVCDVDALRKAGALSISLVAEQAGEVVGHVALSPVSISDGSADWYGLGPIFVRPELQGRGIGSLLMNVAIGVLRERG